MIVQSASRLTVIRAGGTLAFNIMFRLGKMNGESDRRESQQSHLIRGGRSGRTPMSDSKNRFLTLLKARGPDPVIVAHRGDSFRAPENTLEAARLAWQAGADAWELDVQLTRDGVPIVLHDESLLRTTDVATRFKDDPRATDGLSRLRLRFQRGSGPRRRLLVRRRRWRSTLGACVRHARPARAGVGRTLPFRPGDHPHARPRHSA